MTVTALDGVAFDEIVVESNLNVRQKPLPPMRRLQRSPNNPLVHHKLIRSKRQYDGFYYPQQTAFNQLGFNGFGGGGHQPQPQQYGHNFQQPGFYGQQHQGFGGQQAQGLGGAQQQYPGFDQQQQQPSFGGLNNKNQPPHYGGSSSSANANSHSSGFGAQGFGSSVAGAQAQGFEAHGPQGGFGASAANADTQSIQVGPNGFQV